jgi:hypothetical protein
MKSKITPIENGPLKYDVFNVFVGQINDENEIIESHRVGAAFLKGKSKVFSLRLWMFDSVKYFVAPRDEDSTKYDILSIEEYTARDGELRSQWHKVGMGQYFGNYLKLKFHLLEKEIYLSLFPNRKESHESAA